MTTFYPQEPTKWTEGLAPVYDRQTRQLAEHHANLRERDRQEEERAKNESFVKTLANIAEFSSSASKLVKAYKTKQEVKDTETKAKLNDYLNNNPAGTKWFREKLETYEGDRGSFFKEYDRVNREGGLSQLKQDAIAAGQEDFVIGLREIDSRDGLILREGVAANTVQSLPARWDDHFASFNTKQLEDWKNLDGPGKTQFVNNWKIDQVEKLQPGEGFAAKLIAGELKKQSTTSRNLQRASALTAHQTNQTRFFKTLIGTSATSFNRESFGENFVIAVDSRIENFTDIVSSDGTVITARHQAAEAVFNDLQELNIAGFIPDISLLADYKFDHPAGKNGKANIFDAFFDKEGEYYNRLVEGNKIGQTKLLSAATQLDLATLGQLQQAAIKGQDVSQELQLLKNNGLLSDEQIKTVSDIGIHDNTQESYDEVTARYNERNILTGGNLVAHEQDIKQEKNIEFKKKQLARIKHHKERRKQLGYPEDDEAFVKARIKQAFKLTLGDDEDLTGKLRDLQIHLVQKLRKGFQDQIETPDFKPIVDRNSWTLANDEFESYVVKNGIDVDKGEGIFSADGQGRLLNWKPFAKDRVDAIKEFNTEFDSTAIIKYDKEIFDAFNEAKNNSETQKGLTSFDRVLNKPEAVATKEDLLGFFSQGVVSKELVYKARKLGIPVKTLIRRQLEALKDSGLYDDYLKLHGLDEVDFPESADETLDSILAKSGNRDLLYNFNRGYTSPKINQRIIKAYTESFNILGLQDGTQIQFEKDAEKFGNTQAGKAVEALSNK